MTDVFAGEELNMPLFNSPFTAAWRPLQKNRNQIRILELLPANVDSAPLLCQLHIVSLDDNPVYEALSYRWGNINDTKTITLCGQSFKVTSNAFHALEALRLDTESRFLWVDAICIDQKNLEERSHQVNIMGNIYSNALNVRVWLESDYKCNIAPYVLSHASDYSLHFDEEIRNIVMGAISMSSWWRRVWTAQEAVLAKELMFHTGKDHFTLHELQKFLSAMTRHLSAENRCCRRYFVGFGDEPLETFSYFISDLLQRRADLHKSGFQLSELIKAYTHRDSTDLRDKVFGFIGLAKDAPDNIVRYDLSLVDCYTHTATEIIRQTKDLDIFRSIMSPVGRNADVQETSEQRNTPFARRRMQGLPSWVPDWSQGTEFISAQNYTVYQNLCSSFNAGGHTEVNVNFPSAHQLALDGIICDTVHKVAEEISYVHLNVIRCLKSWCTFVAESLAQNVECSVCGLHDRDVLITCAACDELYVCIRCLPRIDGSDKSHCFGIRKILSQKQEKRPNPANWLFEEPSQNPHAFGIRSWEKLALVQYRQGENESVQDAFRHTLVLCSAAVRDTFQPSYNSIFDDDDIQRLGFHIFWCRDVESAEWLDFLYLVGENHEAFSNAASLLSSLSPRPLQHTLGAVIDGKRFFVTRTGFLGLGPANTQPGHRVCVLNGAKVPYILQDLPPDEPRSENGGGEEFTLIGQAYVHGIMNGEAVDLLGKGAMKESRFVLH